MNGLTGKVDGEALLCTAEGIIHYLWQEWDSLPEDLKDLLHEHHFTT